MAKQEFQKYWTLNYLDNILLPHLLKQEYLKDGLEFTVSQNQNEIHYFVRHDLHQF